MPYTAALLNSVPRMDMAGRRDIVLDAIRGNVPDPATCRAAAPSPRAATSSSAADATSRSLRSMLWMGPQGALPALA